MRRSASFPTIRSRTDPRDPRALAKSPRGGELVCLAMAHEGCCQSPREVSALFHALIRRDGVFRAMAEIGPREPVTLGRRT